MSIHHFKQVFHYFLILCVIYLFQMINIYHYFKLFQFLCSFANLFLNQLQVLFFIELLHNLSTCGNWTFHVFEWFSSFLVFGTNEGNWVVLKFHCLHSPSSFINAWIEPYVSYRGYIYWQSRGMWHHLMCNVDKSAEHWH